MGFKSFFLCIALLSMYICYAQPPNLPPNQRFERIEALKKAFATQQLQLSEDEMKQFWPLYNQHLNELKALRRQFFSDEIAFEEGSLEVRKKYRPLFQKLLNNPDRVNKVYILERNFRGMLHRELEKRQGMNHRGPGNGPPGMRRRPPPPPEKDDL